MPGSLSIVPTEATAGQGFALRVHGRSPGRKRNADASGGMISCAAAHRRPWRARVGLSESPLAVGKNASAKLSTSKQREIASKSGCSGFNGRPPHAGAVRSLARAVRRRGARLDLLPARFDGAGAREAGAGARRSRAVRGKLRGARLDLAPARFARAVRGSISCPRPGVLRWRDKVIVAWATPPAGFLWARWLWGAVAAGNHGGRWQQRV